MKVYALTNVGRVRSINQDAFYLPRAGESFAVLADGMGGHRAGEVASAIAVVEFSRWLKCAPRPNEEALRYAVSEANRAIYLQARSDPSKAGMGTTLTAIWMDDETVYLTHVGDSRAYRLRDGELLQMSRDHSVVEELLESGLITPEQAKVHPHRHYITRALGTNSHVEADISRFEHEKSDVWLLCSDGLSNYVEANEIRETLLGRKRWQAKAQHLVDKALERGGADNVTVMIAVCGGGAS